MTTSHGRSGGVSSRVASSPNRSGLHRPDLNRPGLSDDPLWYKDAVIYQVHVRAFFDSNDDGVGDFAGLTRKLDYIQALGVSAIWLQPFYPSPLKDDGYDIAQYEGVHPSYGTRRDFLHFMNEAHGRGLRVITELVINHTSDQHPWFQAARRARRGSSKRNFYVWSDTDQKYAGVPIVFKDTERSNWTWDPVAEQYYWHRFFYHQPDLNFDHPTVQRAVLKVMRFWLDMGVDGMRLDAVPYLVEREGTQCANLPETHAVLKTIRHELDARYRARMLLAEANQWPSDVRTYFGDGDECHMAFHFPLMPRLFMALRQEDRHPLSEILYQMPDIPETCQWAIFLRNHDELTLEMVSDEERDYMYETYAADPQMRLNAGIRRRLAPLMENSRPRIELLIGLLMSMPGTPVLYYGDELGMGDNIYLGDRNGVRTPMQWSADRNGGFSRADPARLYAPAVMDSVYGYPSVNVEAQERSPHSLLSWMRRTIALRQRHATFGRGAMELLRPVNRTIFAFIRRYGTDDPILVVANLSRTVQALSLDLARLAGLIPVEMSGGVELPRITEAPYFLTLGPYAFLWLKLQRETSGQLDDRSRYAAAVEPEPEQSPLLVGPEWNKLLDGSVRHLLEQRYLLPFLRRQGWFDSKAAVDRVSIVDWGALATGDEPVFMLVIAATSGELEARYVLPVAAASGARAHDILRHTPDAVLVTLAGARKGVLHARTDGSIGEAVANVVLSGRSVPLRFGRLQGALNEFMPPQSLPARVEEIPAAPFDREYFISSVTFGERVRLKIVRRLWTGAHPEQVIATSLARAGRTARLPPFFGSAEYRDAAGEPSTIALALGFVPHQSDGWRHTLAEIERYFDLVLTLESAPPATPRLSTLWGTDVPQAARETVGAYLQTAGMIGQRAGELHMALHAAYQAAPGNLSRDEGLGADVVVERVAASWERAWAAILGSAPREDGESAVDRLTQRHDELLTLIHRARLDLPDHLRTSLTHGSLDLAHLILHEGDPTFIAPGDNPSQPPERRLRPRSPLEDVANMLRSFHLAGQATLVARASAAPHQFDRLSGWTRWWTSSAAVAFLSAYRHATADAPFLPDSQPTIAALLRLFMFDQTFDEIRDRLAGGPAWLDVVTTTLEVV